MSDLAAIRIRFECLGPVLDEKLRRLWAAAEARAIGRGGISHVAAATGLSRQTIAAGLRELLNLETAPDGSVPDSETGRQSKYQRQHDRVRLRGAGAKLIEVKDPAIIPALEQLLTDEIAGDPMSEQKWVRSSLRYLSERLTALGHSASPGTVARLLKKMDFSLKTNKRRRGARGRCPERDEQFQYIASQRRDFTAAGRPIISVDTKKKELIGNFRNKGRCWCKEAPEVDEHDFPSQAECLAVPYGVYDVTKNKGYVVVGVSNNTPEFAVSSIGKWWQDEGRVDHPLTDQLLIFADGGGGNGRRARAWKWNLQETLCNGFGLTVTVCHYPPGCSKWNPVDHRLFSQISRNWEGKPLRTLGIMLGYIRGTTTKAGLTVTAQLDEGIYGKGQKVTREDMGKLNLTAHSICPDWNYTIKPMPRQPPDQ